MDEIIVRKRNFIDAKNEIKRVADNLPTEMSFQEFEKEGGLFGLFDHKVTGRDLNVFVEKLQEYLIQFNDVNRNFIVMFNQVYKAFESLDKEYIQSILIAIKSAEKANERAVNAQEDIKRTIEALKITIRKLSEFEEEVKSYRHLDDIDFMWEDIKNVYDNINRLREGVEDITTRLFKKVAILEEFQTTVKKNQYIQKIEFLLNDTDKIWGDIQTLQNVFESTKEKYESLFLSYAKDIRILNDFKKRLDGYTHLQDIDVMWNKSNELSAAVSQHSTDLKAYQDKLEEFNDHMQKAEMDTTEKLNRLFEYKDSLEMYEHLTDVDELWQHSHTFDDELNKTNKGIIELTNEMRMNANELSEAVSQNSSDIKACHEKFEKMNKCMQETESNTLEKINVLFGYKKKLEVSEHLMDVDELWEYSHSLENELNRANTTVAELTNRFESENRDLLQKVKSAYIVAGVALFLILIQGIFNIIGIL